MDTSKATHQRKLCLNQKILLAKHYLPLQCPRQITIDNVKYFDYAMFKDFYQQIGMKVTFASVYHPQSNGAVERANFRIFKAIKKILEGKKKGKWAEVMPTTIWSHNTTVCRATNFTPFRLMYRAEAVLSEEVKHRSL
jgi:hypothetical protein